LARGNSGVDTNSSTNTGLVTSGNGDDDDDRMISHLSLNGGDGGGAGGAAQQRHSSSSGGDGCRAPPPEMSPKMHGTGLSEGAHFDYNDLDNLGMTGEDKLRFLLEHQELCIADHRVASWDVDHSVLQRDGLWRHAQWVHLVSHKLPKGTAATTTTTATTTTGIPSFLPSFLRSFAFLLSLIPFLNILPSLKPFLPSLTILP
jgi:hypothetical protein